MNPFLSKRLLINIAVVVVAVGTNAFVAYTQIRGQRDADARLARSTSVRQNLDAYHAALGKALAAVHRLKESDDPVPPDAAASMTKTLASREDALRDELASEPSMSPALASLSAARHALQHDLEDTLRNHASDLPGAASATSGAASTEAPISAHDDARFDASVDSAPSDPQLAPSLERVEAALASLRSDENRSLQTALAASASDSQRAMFVLLVTMLSRQRAADAHVRRAREQRA
ncbi:CHASE3 domain sensor protein [Paraburkholderia youngii]